MSIRSMLNKVLAAVTAVCALGAMAAEKPSAKDSPKVLIAFYSYSGNTRAAAMQIQKKVGGDLFEIKPAKAYPTNYKNCVAVAKQEIRDGYLPPLAEEIDIAKYSIVFIGSPNWWGTIAPPVGTFIKNSNIEGKIIVPFFTHGGGGMQKCESDVQKYCEAGNAGKILKAFTCPGSSTKEPVPELEQWAADSMKQAVAAGKTGKAKKTGKRKK